MPATPKTGITGVNAGQGPPLEPAECRKYQAKATWMSASATAATQKHQVPRLPHKVELLVGKMCVTKLSVKELCVCVGKLYVSKLYVSKFV